MIIYHPAYDVNHNTYRILNVLYAAEESKVHYDMLKIVDFYYVYPHLLKQIKNLPRPLNYQSTKIESVADSFELTPNPKSLFFEISTTQESAISALVQKSLINIDNNFVSLEKDNLPTDLIKVFENDEFTKSDVFQVLVKSLPKVKLEGNNGLKSRSGLMEYRYD